MHIHNNHYQQLPLLSIIFSISYFEVYMGPREVGYPGFHAAAVGFWQDGLCVCTYRDYILYFVPVQQEAMYYQNTPTTTSLLDVSAISTFCVFVPPPGTMLAHYHLQHYDEQKVFFLRWPSSPFPKPVLCACLTTR